MRAALEGEMEGTPEDNAQKEKEVTLCGPAQITKQVCDVVSVVTYMALTACAVVEGHSVPGRRQSSQGRRAHFEHPTRGHLVRKALQGLWVLLTSCSRMGSGHL